MSQLISIAQFPFEAQKVRKVKDQSLGRWFSAKVAASQPWRACSSMPSIPKRGRGCVQRNSDLDSAKTNIFTWRMILRIANNEVIEFRVGSEFTLCSAC